MYCDDVIIAELIEPFRAGFEHQVIVVAHDRIGADIDRKQRGQQANTVHDPLAPVLVALAGVMIHPAQKGAAQSLPHEVFWVRSAR